MKKILSILICLMMFLTSFSFVACNGSTQGSILGAKEDVTYTITVDDNIANGSVSASQSKVKIGESVTFTATPQSGYVLANFVLNGGKVKGLDNKHTVKNVLRDFNVSAVFAKEQITVTYVGAGTDGLSGKIVNYGDVIGELDTPTTRGSYFVGWQDADGNFVTEYDVANVVTGEIELSAVYNEYTEKDKENQTPFTITTSYYDQAATKIGVSWHTRVEPVNPMVLIAEGDTNDFSSAVGIKAEKYEWLSTPTGKEWINSAVVENLKFNTTYSVMMGDYSVDAWSKVYTFTTREENIEETSFVFMADTQEQRHTSGVTDTGRVINDAISRFPETDFITHGGDIVHDAAFACHWEETLGAFDEYLFNYPMQVVAGNHEEPTSYGKTSNTHNVDKLFNVDYPGKDLGYRMDTGVFYSFDYGPLHYVCLNSNDLYVNGRMLKDVQVQWFYDDVAAARENEDIKWVVVMIHHAIYPSSKNQDLGYNAQLIKMLDNANVDLLLYGHGHYIDSSYPIVWDDSLSADVWGLKARNVTTNVQKVSHDGVTVEQFVYSASTADRGTVIHQTGCAGSQTNNTMLTYKLEDYPMYRALISGDYTANVSGKTVSMYSYVEVSQNQLVCRTYGVDPAGQKTISNNGGDILSAGYYLDGFMLTK